MSTQFVAWLDCFAVEHVSVVAGQRRPVVTNTEFWGAVPTLLCQVEDEHGETWVEHLPAADLHRFCD